MPINRAKEKLEEYRSTGQISHPVIGISQTFFVQGDLAEALTMPTSGGLLIQGIDDGSPAAAVEVRGPSRTVIVGNRYRIGVGGDLIIAIDGNPVNGQDALPRAMNQKRPGETMVLTIYRGNRTMKVTVTLGSSPRSAVIRFSKRSLIGVLEALGDLSLCNGAFLDHAPVDLRDIDSAGANTLTHRRRAPARCLQYLNTSMPLRQVGRPEIFALVAMTG